MFENVIKGLNDIITENGAYINKNILDFSNDGINIVDDKCILICVNKVSCGYANSSNSRMIGQHISRFYPQAALQEVVKTGTPIINKKVTYKDGRRYMVSAYPFISDNKITGGIAIFKNIDDIESLHEKIKELKFKINISYFAHRF